MATKSEKIRKGPAAYTPLAFPICDQHFPSINNISNPSFAERYVFNDESWGHP